MARNHGDWGALCLAEIKGNEKPGTVAKLLAEATGKKPPAQTDEGDALGGLLKLAELVSADKPTKARIAELKAEQEVARAQIVAAGRERVAVDKKKADTEADLAKQRAAHDDKIAAEVAAHEARMKAGADDLAARAKALAEQTKALDDRDAALKAKADALRQHLEAAA